MLKQFKGFHMRKFTLILVFVMLFTGCSVGGDGDTAKVPGFSNNARRDGMILKELQKQTSLLNEINQKLDNQLVQPTQNNLGG